MILLLHGFLGSPESFEALRSSLPGQPSEALPLSGHRGVPEDAFSWSSEVDRLAAEIDRRRDPLQLVGYSLGGRLALAVALRRPERITRLSLIGAQPGLGNAREREARRAADAAWAARLEAQGLGAFLDAWEAQPLFASQARLPPEQLGRQRELRLGHHAGALAQALRALGLAEMGDLWPALADLRVPVDLIHGADDPKFGATAARMAAALPDARLLPIAGAGHNPILERPGAVAELLGEPKRAEHFF